MKVFSNLNGPQEFSKQTPNRQLFEIRASVSNQLSPSCHMHGTQSGPAILGFTRDLSFGGRETGSAFG